MGVGYRISYNKCSVAVRNAARYLKEKHNISVNETVMGLVEAEFNIKVIYNTDDYYGYEIRYIQFENEHEAVVFLLRWQ